MIAHYLTFLALSRELDRILHHKVVDEIFTQEKDQLTVAVDNLQALVISIRPGLNYVTLRGGVHRAKRNSVNLFSDRVGRRIDRCGMKPFDRSMEIQFDDGATFHLQLFNSASSNVLLTDGSGLIRDALHNKSKLRDTAIVIRPASIEEQLLKDVHELFHNLVLQGEKSVHAALKSMLPVTGTLLVREALFRAGVEPESPASRITEGQCRDIHTMLGKLWSYAESPDPGITRLDDGGELFSIMPLQHLGSVARTEGRSIHEAVGQVAVGRLRSGLVSDERGKILEGLKRELERSRIALRRTEEDIASGARADDYERFGGILLTHLHEIRKGLRTISLPDMSDESVVHTISLDPARTPAQNADQYFERARKARAARSESLERRQSFNARTLLLERMYAELGEIDEWSGLKDFRKVYEKELGDMNILPKESAAERPPFRIFTVAGEYEVWVGKNSANNDLLTMKFAKPHDLWFHVRGAGGSHTVLKVKSGIAPPREAVRAAARIAAYYSKMRKAGNVPVAYCERKYVRKPRNSAEGAVVLEREEIVFVHPGLP